MDRPAGRSNLARLAAGKKDRLTRIVMPDLGGPARRRDGEIAAFRKSQEHVPAVERGNALRAGRPGAIPDSHAIIVDDLVLVGRIFVSREAGRIRGFRDASVLDVD